MYNRLTLFNNILSKYGAKYNITFYFRESHEVRVPLLQLFDCEHLLCVCDHELLELVLRMLSKLPLNVCDRVLRAVVEARVARAAVGLLLQNGFPRPRTSRSQRTAARLSSARKRAASGCAQATRTGSRSTATCLRQKTESSHLPSEPLLGTARHRPPLGTGTTGYP